MNASRRLASALLLAPLAAACSSEDPAKTGEPLPDNLEVITGAKAPSMGAAGFTLPAGYVEEEYVISGTATDYVASGGLTDDGLWTFAPDTTADYRTRILVRRPANAADASGTVVVEWLNVSGGIDANPDYTSLEEEIARQGHIWVGVSAQLIGVEGGPVLVTVSVPEVADMVGKGLKVIDPERYGSLVHPGDGYAFDMFTQVALTVREGGAMLGGASADVVIAAGESQSAIALTTYYNGVQPLTSAFDGFFVHSRGAPALPLVAPGAYADLGGAIITAGAAKPVLRGDLDAPVVELQAESDVTGILSSSTVRQPDTGTFRLWEVAGTAHADAHLLGSVATSIDCGVPINDGPMHVVAKAAFHGLETWVRGGAAPQAAPLLELTGTTPAISRDADGIAIGGLRTPPIDVPVEVLSGAPGPSTDIICILLGSTTPLGDARIAALYTNRADYQAKYAAGTDQAIQAGFVLEADRALLTGYSKPLFVLP